MSLSKALYFLLGNHLPDMTEKLLTLTMAARGSNYFCTTMVGWGVFTESLGEREGEGEGERQNINNYKCFMASVVRCLQLNPKNTWFMKTAGNVNIKPRDCGFDLGHVLLSAKMLPNETYTLLLFFF